MFSGYDDIRLSSYNTNTGTVLIKFNNIYGRICPDGWDNNAARVVCRELGYRDGTPYTHYENAYYGSYKPYWTSNVKCQGFERTLQQCKKTDYGKVTSCSTQHSAGVLCFRHSGKCMVAALHSNDCRQRKLNHIYAQMIYLFKHER
jgi:hypothetical protein